MTKFFPIFRRMINTHFGKNNKRVRFGDGKEYFNQFLISFQKQGIVHESTCVHTPQQNEVVERKNRHLVEVVRKLLFQSNVPKLLLGKRFNRCYLTNRLPSYNLGCWPNLSRLSIQVVYLEKTLLYLVCSCP